MIRRLTAFLAGAACILGISASALAAADDCDRACLKTALDQYLTAVTTHKPSAAPLFAGFRQTENAVVVPLGSGVWKTVTSLGKVQRKYLDAVSGQAAFYGIIEESGGLRLQRCAYGWKTARSPRPNGISPGRQIPD